MEERVRRNKKGIILFMFVGSNRIKRMILFFNRGMWGLTSCVIPCPVLEAFRRLTTGLSTFFQQTMTCKIHLVGVSCVSPPECKYYTSDLRCECNVLQ